MRGELVSIASIHQVRNGVEDPTVDLFAEEAEDESTRFVQLLEVCVKSSSSRFLGQPRAGSGVFMVAELLRTRRTWSRSRT